MQEDNEAEDKNKIIHNVSPKKKESEWNYLSIIRIIINKESFKKKQKKQIYLKPLPFALCFFAIFKNIEIILLTM